MNNKSKTFMIFSVLTLIIVVIVSSTYAWYVWTTDENDTIKIVTKVGGAKVTFDGGSDISANLRPVSDKSKGIVKNISIKADTSNLTFNLYLDINSIDEELKHSSFKYALYNGEEEKVSGNFSSYTTEECTKNSTNHIVLLEDEPISTTKTIYTLYIWIDGKNEVNPSSMMNKTFNFNLHADGQDAVLIEEASTTTLKRLNTLNSSIAVDTLNTPDFSNISGEDGDGTNGIYTAEDNDGTTYYFRGAVDNNYVVFGDFVWRIVRINGDGSVKMIYFGEAELNDEISRTLSVDKYNYNITYGESVAYNINNNDNAYVGFMYGTLESSTYEDIYTNIHNSTIKEYLDDWYVNNLKNYETYIADTIYCNDRSIVSTSIYGIELTGSGIGKVNTAYSSITRDYLNNSISPNLKCINENDKLKLKIGLITSDEVIFAGANCYDFTTNNGISNYEFYLYQYETSYWTMTPSFFFADGILTEVYGIGAFVNAVNNGYLHPFGYVSTDNFFARPVISLKFDAITGGQGTYEDPFTIG